MKFIADLHVHSSFSRATSKAANLEGYYQWAKVKGIHLIGTGDFTHPAWLDEMKEKLVPDGNGFFVLKHPPPDLPGEFPPLEAPLNDIDIRFCLSAELSTIYKKDDKTRKVHSVLFAPDFDTVEKIRAKLNSLGKNLKSDGRPILGLDTKDLLEIVLEASDRAYLVPAHIWTPWFSLFGSNSGFDRIEDCFEDLTEHIFALETGLSSDPEMNWRWSALDRYTLISNSDAHSPRKLGREANRFDTDFTYDSMFGALKTGKGYGGTIEFYPEEGKYHLDGHRKCGICLEPEETREYNGICPECGKKLTVGVMHRVLELADRKKGRKPETQAGFRYLIPLPEIISEITGNGVTTKSVYSVYGKVLQLFGNEFTFLLDTPIQEIERESGSLFAEAIKRMRSGKINPKPGFDGEFGVIKVFDRGELEKHLGQQDLFSLKSIRKKLRSNERKNLVKNALKKKDKKEKVNQTVILNPSQQKVLGVTSGSILVTAGPGTGKTRTLTSWINHILASGYAEPGEILAVTFTNRAAEEMKERLSSLPGHKGKKINISTFHGFCFEIINKRFPSIITVFDDIKRAQYLHLLFPEMKKKEIKKFSLLLKQSLEFSGRTLPEEYRSYAQTYLDAVKKSGGIDLSALVAGLNQLFRKEPDTLESVRIQYKYIAVDELQDINDSQYLLIKNLFSPSHQSVASDNKKNRGILAIGDPDQAIYGFRGSDLSLFYSFQHDYNPAEITLDTNYRSTEQILEAGAAVIRHNKQHKKISLISAKGNGELINCYRAQDPAEEGKFIARRIEQLVGGMSFTAADLSYDSGAHLYSFKDIAVLARTKAVFNDLVSFLGGAGIPIGIHHETPLIQEPPFSTALNVLSYLLHGKDIVALHDIFSGFYTSFPDDELLKIVPLFIDHKKDADSLIQIFSGNNSLTEQQYADAVDFFSFIKKLSDCLEAEGVKGVLEKVFEKYISHIKTDMDIALKMETLCEAAGRYKSDLAGYLRASGLHPNESEGSITTDKVHLLTFHAAKGCEFPVVFIAGAEEGITPVKAKNTDIDEERRLFYVALTRAKDLLVISSASKRKVFGKWREAKSSRFLEEIPQSLVLNEINKSVKQKEEPYGQPLLF